MREARDTRMECWRCPISRPTTSRSCTPSHRERAAVRTPRRRRSCETPLSVCSPALTSGRGIRRRGQRRDVGVVPAGGFGAVPPDDRQRAVRAVCAPMYRRLIWTMENGAAIEIVAPSASAVNRYIQSVRVDGQAWDRITIERERLVEGAVIEFDLGPQPSVWARGDGSASVDAARFGSMPPVDLTSPGGRGAIGGVDAGNAFDDSSGTAPAVVESGGALGWEFEAPTALDHYTLTVDEPGEYSWEFSSARSRRGVAVGGQAAGGFRGDVRRGSSPSNPFRRRRRAGWYSPGRCASRSWSSCYWRVDLGRARRLSWETTVALLNVISTLPTTVVARACLDRSKLRSSSPIGWSPSLSDAPPTRWSLRPLSRSPTGSCA